MELYTHAYFMGEALKEAHKARGEDEIPIGAVVVYNDLIIGRGYNQTERLQDVTAHAEILAITAAENYIGSKYLTGCRLFVTLEPCIMCAGAIMWSQIHELIYGATDLKKGFHLYTGQILHPRTLQAGGVLAAESAQLLSTFFISKR